MMTRQEAEGAARRRYGPRCFVRETSKTRSIVMVYPSAGRREVLGTGASWEAAFEDADARSGAPDARHFQPATMAAIINDPEKGGAR